MVQDTTNSHIVLENRLSHEASPYLQQHKDNPVHWQPWDAKALASAQEQNKPILLSIGYSACHWCHVMAHESFENEDIASVMNDLFVNIKVDREERPDIDDIYMSALHMMGEQGGWPLTMFLLPDGRPFWGGTYFPPIAKFGRPGFPDICREIARICTEETDKVQENADKLTQALQNKNNAAFKAANQKTALEQLSPNLPLGLPEDLASEASENLARQIDLTYGGMQGAPKFPQPLIYELLWQDWLRNGRDVSREAVLITLSGLCHGGIFDHIRGGFSRYSVDEEWLVPHFEKMIYDNGLILDLMGNVWKSTRDPMLTDRISKTVDWLLDDMLTNATNNSTDGAAALSKDDTPKPPAAFAASLDADSEGEEGKYYVWTVAELTSLLGENFPDFARTYRVTDAGNFPEGGGAGDNVNILNRLPPSLHNEGFDEEARHAQSLNILAQAQALRTRPERDDKILADWNGLVIAALARLSPVFQNKKWLETAERAYRDVMQTMSYEEGGCLKLAHAARGESKLNISMAEDYSNMADAALALFSATGTASYLASAEALTKTLEQFYTDDVGGFYMTSSQAETLITRPHTSYDGATPNANGTMIGVYRRLAVFTGKQDYRDSLEALIKTHAIAAIKHYPQMPRYLTETENTRHQASCVIVGDPSDNDFKLLLETAHAHPCPGLIVHPVGLGQDLPTHIPIHETPANPTKNATDDKMPFAFDQPTAYVCTHNTCLPPANSVDELTTHLDSFLHKAVLETA
ncbi:hypothetical protein IMCC14465_08640 [alpha proteobacterium IMCC14465]|uniref:Spermatogenesis-associated protein 20-like TRX domain-containing protein n=1 Tax=alpha proteobacterium IMCC14465 TaxID=1220535 RepID=J9DG43_9PROT|nr:hypothetical protein IMCC14465_08640 [alpha proteobacterium IMCC14465]